MTSQVIHGAFSISCISASKASQDKCALLVEPVYSYFIFPVQWQTHFSTHKISLSHCCKFIKCLYCFKINPLVFWKQII